MAVIRPRRSWGTEKAWVLLTATALLAVVTAVAASVARTAADWTKS
jgi:hypothetical protein